MNCTRDVEMNYLERYISECEKIGRKPMPIGLASEKACPDKMLLTIGVEIKFSEPLFCGFVNCCDKCWKQEI